MVGTVCPRAFSFDNTFKFNFRVYFAIIFFLRISAKEELLFLCLNRSIRFTYKYKTEFLFFNLRN